MKKLSDYLLQKKVIIIITALFVASGVALVFVIYFMPQCNTENGIKVCINVSDRAVQQGQELEVIATLTNTTDEAQEFKLRHSRDSLYMGILINRSGEPYKNYTNGIIDYFPAGATTILSPGDSFSDTTIIPADKLQPGENTIQAKWRHLPENFSSPELTIQFRD